MIAWPIKKQRWHVGDRVWIIHQEYGKDFKAMEGEIEAVFDIRNHLCNPHYCISVFNTGDHIRDNDLVVRDNSGLGIWSKNPNADEESFDERNYDGC
jgi:hypothetical protein